MTISRFAAKELLALATSFVLSCTAGLHAQGSIKDYLQITQIHYAPLSNSSAEYVELINVSFTETIDLTGVKFTSGIEFDFTGSEVTSLFPGQKVIVVKNKTVFEANYTGLFFGPLVAGEFANDSSLDDLGEELVLEDSSGEIVFKAHYRQNAQWPHRDGHPIVYDAGFGFGTDPETAPDHALPTSWTTARGAGGYFEFLTPRFRTWLAERGQSNPLTVVDQHAELLNYAFGRDLAYDYTYEHRLEKADGDPYGFSTVVIGDDETPEDFYQTLSITVRNYADVDIDLQTSTDLVVWKNTTNYEIVEEYDHFDGTSFRKYRLDDPVTPGQNVFVRVKVTE